MSHNRLPVDCDRVDNRNYIKDLPRLRIEVPRELDDRDADFMIGRLVDEISSKADRNPARTFAFNFWGTNGFENKDFEGLVMLLMLYTIVEDARDVRRFVDDELGLFVGAAISNLVAQYPDLERALNNDELDGIRRAEDHFRHIMARCDRATRGRRDDRRDDRGYGRGRYDDRRDDRGYGRDRYDDRDRGRNDRYDDRGRGGSRGLSDPYAERGESRRSSQTYTGPASVSGGMNSGAVVSRGGISAVDDAPRRDDRRDAAPIRQERAASLRTSDRRVVETEQGPVILIEPYDTEATTTYGPSSPPFAYDRKAYQHYLTAMESAPDTILPGEAILNNPKENDVEGYLAHELDEKLRQVYRSNLGAHLHREHVEAEVVKARTLVPTRTGGMAVPVTQEEREALKEAGAPVTLVESIWATSQEDAAMKADLEAFGMDIKPDIIEYNVHERAGTILMDNTGDAVVQLQKAESYAAFLHLAGEMHRDGRVDDAFIELLDNLLTVRFNRYLTKQLIIDVTIASFFADYVDFMAYLEKKHGRQVSDLTAASYRQILAATLHQATPAEIQRVIGELSEEKQALVHNPAVFVSNYTVSQLPWTMLEMQQRWRLEGVVTLKHAKDLHETIQAIFARSQPLGVQEVRLRTADDRVIYVYPAAFTLNAVDGSTRNYAITCEPIKVDTVTAEQRVM